VGLHAAIQFVEQVGFAAIMNHERELTDYALHELSRIPGIRILTAPAPQAGVISFVLDCAHPHDIATVFAHDGIAVRAGHHCAMPLMELLGVSSTVRLSLGLYNSRSDIDSLVNSLKKVVELFS